MWYRKEYDNTVIDDSEFSEILDEYESNYYWVDELNQSWKAWQEAKAQAIPEGFVVVPKEPTQELLNKMQDFFVGAFENGLTGGQSIHCAYIAMIEAQEQAND